MRLLVLLTCLLLPGCLSTGYMSGSVDLDGTALRFEDATLRVEAVGKWTDWAALEFSAAPSIRLSAEGQTATVTPSAGVVMTGPIQTGTEIAMCKMTGSGDSVITISTPDDGTAEFNLELPAC